MMRCSNTAPRVCAVPTHTDAHCNYNAASRAKAKYETCYRRINDSSAFTVGVFSSFLPSVQPPLSPQHWAAAQLSTLCAPWHCFSWVSGARGCGASNMTIRIAPFSHRASLPVGQLTTTTTFLPVFQLFSFTPLVLAIAAQTNSGGSVSGRLTSCCSVNFCRVISREHV